MMRSGKRPRSCAASRGSSRSIRPLDFTGALREYQREGLGWLQFLERFGFGGCLADDMGLGKTVQVLALLAGRAKAKKRQEQTADADRRAALAGVQLDAGSRPLRSRICRSSTTPAWPAAKRSSTSRTATSSSPPMAPCAATCCSSRTPSSITASSTKPRSSRTPAPNRPRRCGFCRPTIGWP